MRCQMIVYTGEKDMPMPLLGAGVKGIDRIVPVGHTRDFDLIWDGYDLTEREDDENHLNVNQVFSLRQT